MIYDIIFWVTMYIAVGLITRGIVIFYEGTQNDRGFTEERDQAVYWFILVGCWPIAWIAALCYGFTKVWKNIDRVIWQTGWKLRNRKKA
jgi:hypothetical protein